MRPCICLYFTLACILHFSNLKVFSVHRTVSITINERMSYINAILKLYCNFIFGLPPFALMKAALEVVSTVGFYYLNLKIL